MYFIIFLGVTEDVLSAQYYTWSVIYLKTVFIDFNKDCVCKYVCFHTNQLDIYQQATAVAQSVRAR